jgi:hypothetical protein
MIFLGLSIGNNASLTNLARIAMMKKWTSLIIFCLSATLFSLVYSPTSFAKKRCKTFQNKLHNIQTMQRKGYSLKRGESLRIKEDKAREKWWKCEHSSKAKFQAQYGGGKKKAKKVKNKKTIKNNTNFTKTNKKLPSSKKKPKAFNQNTAIVIKSKYEGSKKQDWLTFYSQPIKCQRPKSISVFAYCSENKMKQQSEFEKNYRD